ncbi:signal recognition particle subunit [Dimargaris cristalligena]|uniref:Signal recognition particle, SRP19 subunit n=1 Tax=Dimargaris cristalligena TaxID=215637 RepID=A0A4P9ZW88_9FUNG|nr:signal recognition particle subunit [Dimargaris cristalligena]RKP37568.1 signal recognition particle, SRP19 subunit [Dimargaris cristalligena]|eukprot:RKP37568.1 signal recognition particle, SRP19 subunit [Dimargaris cristalligena]
MVTIEDDDDDIDNMDFPLPLVPTSLPADLGHHNVKYVTDDARFKDWVCLYPLYFDRNHSIEEGRRVNLDLAVERPRVRHLAEAVSDLHLELLFEPDKIHPRDFLNPGRVKVQLRHEGGQLLNSSITDRKSLYRKVARLLPEIMETLTIDELDMTEEEVAKQLKQLMEDPPQPTHAKSSAMAIESGGSASSSAPPSSKKPSAKAERQAKKNGRKGRNLV